MQASMMIELDHGRPLDSFALSDAVQDAGPPWTGRGVVVGPGFCSEIRYDLGAVNGYGAYGGGKWGAMSALCR